MARIAWIEDDYKMIGSLVKRLEEDGHTILPFGSWQEVEERIETVCKCDAVILDVILPPIKEDDFYTGLYVVKQLREQHMYQGPIVICSRVANPEVLHQLHALGVTSILRKPVLPSALYKVMTKALAHGDKSAG